MTFDSTASVALAFLQSPNCSTPHPNTRVRTRVTCHPGEGEICKGVKRIVPLSGLCFLCGPRSRPPWLSGPGTSGVLPAVTGPLHLSQQNDQERDEPVCASSATVSFLLQFMLSSARRHGRCSRSICPTSLNASQLKKQRRASLKHLLAFTVSCSRSPQST